LTALYLNRVETFDRNGIKLNSIPVLNPAVLAEAEAADRRLAQGDKTPLLGVPYTVKDSFKVKGLTVAAGSPAFRTLRANEDAFTVQQIRAAGGVLIGKTNMPPLANGGMQRGVYGRAESPYNADYLTAAWASGSSNGSATSTAASLAGFGMGEETVSSGRSPASNNGLVAYTPSRGMISIRGNWPLFPLRDVVVPHTRTVSDLFAVLDVIVRDDPVAKGDFWREQTVVALPKVSAVRPERFASLARADALRGKRVGVPTMYIGKDPTLTNPIQVRPSILALWKRAADDLRALGAEVVEVDFAPMHEYDADRPGTEPVTQRGLMPDNWWFRRGGPPGPNAEMNDLAPWAYEQFLKSCEDPAFPSWSVVDADLVFPDPPGSVEARGKGLPHGYAATKARIVAGLTPPEQLPNFRAALLGTENLRKQLFEDWMTRLGLDAIVFPANADVGRADSDVNETSYADANRNGVFFSNTNHMLRHLGIPSVSVAMGVMEDIGMPVNLTLAGRAYSDNDLLAYAYAYESATHRRVAPSRTPELPDETFEWDPGSVTAPAKRAEKSPPLLKLEVVADGAGRTLRITGNASDRSGIARVSIYVDGVRLAGSPSRAWNLKVPAGGRNARVMVVAKDKLGNAAALMRDVTFP
jgi:amidase